MCHLESVGWDIFDRCLFSWSVSFPATAAEVAKGGLSARAHAEDVSDEATDRQLQSDNHSIACCWFQATLGSMAAENGLHAHVGAIDWKARRANRQPVTNFGGCFD